LSTWNNIGSAIDQVAQGGKASFKDLARSVIADLGSMIAQAMVFNAIKTAFAAFGFGIPGLAMGGPAQAGQPYIVGEKGPELFIPKSAGTVIPNNKLGSQSQAAPIQQAQATNVTNNVYNISAVDAKSVAALFYENRRALLGTMNVAQKELPYGAMR
jgi:phage-related minor tail protein